MRPIPALLCLAGLAAAPASAAAGSSPSSPSSTDPWSGAPTQAVETVQWSTAKGRLGVTVMSLTPELRAHYGAPTDRGVLVAHVEPGSPAAAAGIAVGDVIVEVHGKAIDAAPDVLAALADVGKGQHAAVALVRDHATRTLDATLADPARSVWSPPWLHDDEWMKSFPAHPFDPAKWFGAWWGPLDVTPPPATPSWIDRLREAFTPKSPQICQRP